MLSALRRLSLGGRRLLAAAGLASVATVAVTLTGASAAAAPTTVTPPPSHGVVQQAQTGISGSASAGTSHSGAVTSTPTVTPSH